MDRKNPLNIRIRAPKICIISIIQEISRFVPLVKLNPELGEYEVDYDQFECTEPHPILLTNDSPTPARSMSPSFGSPEEMEESRTRATTLVDDKSPSFAAQFDHPFSSLVSPATPTSDSQASVTSVSAMLEHFV